MGKRKTPHGKDDDEYWLSESPTSSTSTAKVKRRAPNKGDFALGHVPDLQDSVLDPINWERLKSDEPPVTMTGATYRELDELISSWAEKYAVDDIHEIETSLSTEQKESIIAALEGYCAQLSWKTFTDELPKLVYLNLPKLFTHARISKNLHQKILCNPFYYLDDQYAANVPLFASKPPPAGTALFLKFLLRDMILTRRDDAFECRKLMLRCLHAPNFRSRNEPGQPDYHMRVRNNAQRIIIDDLLSDFDLRALLKTKQPTDNERKDMDRIYSMADELCIRMNMTTKDMQFRYWETLPLYDSHSRIMELAPISKTADRERKRVEKHSGTKTKKAGNRSSPTINRRFVVLTLRPAFSYFRFQPYHWKRPGLDGTKTKASFAEHLLC